MNKTIISAAVLLLAFASCQTSVPQPETLSSGSYTLSLTAAKTPVTKALAVDGKTLSATWGENDRVSVRLQGSDEVIGTLAPAAAGESTTKLEGDITLASPAPGQKLELMFPGTGDWTYGGQDGTLATLAQKCDFATATVEIESVADGHVSTSDASFGNRQAIVTFNLKDSNGDPLQATVLDIATQGGKLIWSYTLSGGAYSPVYGTVYVEATEPRSDFTVAILNEQETEDVYLLTATVGDTKYRCVKSGVVFEPGKYYIGNVRLSSDPTYTVAGDASLCGTEWAPTDPSNDMTLSDGIWSKTFTGVPAGEHFFKVVRNHSWDDASWPERDGDNDNNYYLRLFGTANVTVSFDPSTGYIGTEVVYGNPSYTVAGDPVFGSTWDPTDTDNDMTADGDGKYVSKAYRADSACTVKFKVVRNHSWDDASWPGSDYEHYMRGPGYITITFYPEIGEVSLFAEADVYSIAGDFNGWNAQDTSTEMTKQEDGTYVYVATDIPAGWREFKVVANHSWDWDHGKDGVMGGENWSFEHVSGDVTFTFDPATGLVTTSE